MKRPTEVLDPGRAAVAMPESGCLTSNGPDAAELWSTLVRCVQLPRLVRCHGKVGPLVITPSGLS